MVKTSRSNAVDVGKIPAQKAKIPHALWPKNQNIKQKKYCNKSNKDLKKERESEFWKVSKGRGRSQDGGGLGRGDHFLSYKFIERTIERWAKFTKQLLIASSGHQAPRKAAHCLRREVGQNIKDKKGDKRARDGDPSREGSLNRGSFQSAGNPRAGGSEGSFSSQLGGKIKKGPQITCLKATPSRKVPLTPAPAASKRGRSGEEPAALLRVRAAPEGPESSRRELF